MRKKTNIKKQSQKKCSILQKNDEFMKLFKNKKERLQEINTKINSLKKEIETLNKSESINNINNTLNKINILKNREILYKTNEKLNELLKMKNEIETNQDQTKYILDTANILNQYILLEENEAKLYSLQEQTQNENNPQFNFEIEMDKINTQKRILENDYYTLIDPNYKPNLNILKSNFLIFCENCNDNLHIEGGSAVCYNCGNCYTCIHNPDTLSYKEQQDVDYRHQFTYNKISHLEEWIKRFQAKENKEISQEILDKVILEAHKAKIYDLNKLEDKHVKAFLKKLKLNDYYDNIIAIINRINKRPPFVLTQQIENKIREMFQQMQEPFEKYKGTRKNMLSYGYILHKYFLILDLPEFSKYIKLLKNPEKLRQQDDIFKKIVDHMVEIDPKTNWRFFPSL